MKRKNINQWLGTFNTLAYSLAAIFAAFLLSSLLMVLVGLDVVKAWSSMVSGSFGSPYNISVTLVKTTPLILGGLGMAVAYRSGLFNIGGDGQMYVGGLAAFLVSQLNLGLPVFLQIILALVAAFGAGALWAAIPGYWKAKHNTNIIITTILLNYIAQYFIDFCVYGPLRADKSSAVSLPESLSIPHYLSIILPRTRLHSGFLIALCAFVIVYLFIHHTALGKELCVMGSNPEAARTVGISVVKKTIIAMAISGGLAGLGGGIELMGVQYKLRSLFVSGMGYSGAVVALMGNNSPIGVVLSALLFGFLSNGAYHMQAEAAVPTPLVSIVEGLTILFVVAFMAARSPQIRQLFKRNCGLARGVIKEESQNG